MMTDPIADMLTRIRNASLVRKAEVVLPFSKIKLAIAKLLVREGYLAGVEERTDTHPYIVLQLKYVNGQAAIRDLKRISTPGARCYAKHDKLKRVLNGFGMAIISTPTGLLTDNEARQAKIGGEIICEVY
jgi:small subunit ribosomal protein S8